MLTIKDLKELQPGIFATGIIRDEPGGLNMSGSGRLLKWVAVRGGDIYDWCIYCHFTDEDMRYTERRGDKVCAVDNIKRLVPCDDEAFQMYRY